MQIPEATKTTLQIAAGNGNIKLVQILLATGTDVDAPAADSEEGTESSAYCIRGTACFHIEMLVFQSR